MGTAAVIQGAVTPNREADVPLEVQDARGMSVRLRAFVDTGFNGFLTLPSAVIQSLSLHLQGTRDAMLADGSIIPLDIYRAVVIWDGHPRAVQVLSADGGPLIGMSLLYGFELRVAVVDGGAVTIAALP